MQSIPPELWNYAIALYARPGISDICLLLQDDFGCDVNLLLFACWYGSYHGEIDNQFRQGVQQWSIPWRDNIVSPLRSSRRWLKQALTEQDWVSEESREQFEAIRTDIKRQELVAEKLQLDHLAAMAAGHKTPAEGESAAAIQANLRQLGSIRQDSDPHLNQLLSQLTEQALLLAEAINQESPDSPSDC